MFSKNELDLKKVELVFPEEQVSVTNLPEANKNGI